MRDTGDLSCHQGRRRGSVLGGGGAGCAAAPAPAAKVSPSLPPPKGRRPGPGPEILYQPLAAAPAAGKRQGLDLEGAADPHLGSSAYRKGEFLYQGYLYDDHGAKETARSRPTR